MSLPQHAWRAQEKLRRAQPLQYHASPVPMGVKETCPWKQPPLGLSCLMLYISYFAADYFVRNHLVLESEGHDTREMGWGCPAARETA